MFDNPLPLCSMPAFSQNVAFVVWSLFCVLGGAALAWKRK